MKQGRGKNIRRAVLRQTAFFVEFVRFFPLGGTKYNGFRLFGDKHTISLLIFRHNMLKP